MGSQRGNCTALPNADAISNRATSSEKAAILQPREVGLPVVFTVRCIIVHEKYKVPLIELPSGTKADSRKRFRFTPESGHVRRKRGDSSAPTELSCARILLKISTTRERTGHDQTDAG